MMHHARFVCFGVVLIGMPAWSACDGGAPASDSDDGGTDEAGGSDGRDAFETDDAVFRETIVMPPVCGDRVVDPGEGCDDGNRLNGDDCDWLCRPGPGSFEYPGLDPDVPAITDTGPHVVAVDVAERPRWPSLAWGPGVYGLAYTIRIPYTAVRFRVLNIEGRTVAGPWTRPVAFDVPKVALAWNGADFGVFWQDLEIGILKFARIDPAAVLVAERPDVRRLPADAEWLILEEMIWNAGRYFLASWASTNRPTGPDVLLEAVGPGGDLLPLSSWLGSPYAGLGTLLAVGDGVAAVLGHYALIFDRNLELLRWSGFIADDSAPPVPAAGHVVATEEGFLVFSAMFMAYDQPLDLWVSGFDLAGTMVLPPRMILPDFIPDSTSWFRAAYGPAGAAVVYGHFLPTSEYEVRIVNTDRWGNIRSGPAVVFEPDIGVNLNNDSFQIVADDSGYAVLAWACPRGVGGDCGLVFRRYVPAR